MIDNLNWKRDSERELLCITTILEPIIKVYEEWLWVIQLSRVAQKQPPEDALSWQWQRHATTFRTPNLACAYTISERFS